MSRLGIFLLAPLAIALCEMHLALAQTTAISANDFLNSIGAVSAISRRGEDLANTIDAARYLGLHWFRLGYESRIPVADLIELHNQTGVRFSYGFLSGGTNIPRLLDGARQLAEAGALIAIEGLNEPNNWGITYQDEKGGRDLPWLPVAKLQRDLYNATKDDPVLRKYPVWSLSENGAEVDNIGPQSSLTTTQFRREDISKWEFRGQELRGPQDEFVPGLRVLINLSAPSKWISKDGKILWLVFSGRPSDPMYSFNLIQVKMEIHDEDISRATHVGQ